MAAARMLEVSMKKLYRDIAKFKIPVKPAAERRSR